MRSRMQRLVVLTLVAGGGLTLALASTAHALGGSRLAAGNHACTEWLQTTDNGVYIGGHAFTMPDTHPSPGTFTVRISDTMGGPETEIFRLVSKEFYATHARPTSAGTFFYRSCVHNTSGQEVYSASVYMEPWPGSVLTFRGGPTTAVLGPNGSVCGGTPFLGSRGRLVASATAPVRWRVRGHNEEDYSTGSQYITAASVDRVFDLGPETVGLNTCVTNTSGTTATLAWELLEE